jgi:hypothetical protein
MSIWKTYIYQSGLFRYRIKWKSAIGLIFIFDAFIAAVQAREQEFDQGDHNEEEDLPEPPRFVFSIHSAIESKGPAYCRSVLKFSWKEFLQFCTIAEPLMKPTAQSAPRNPIPSTTFRFAPLFDLWVPIQDHHHRSFLSGSLGSTHCRSMSDSLGQFL